MVHEGVREGGSTGGREGVQEEAGSTRGREGGSTGGSTGVRECGSEYESTERGWSANGIDCHRLRAVDEGSATGGAAVPVAVGAAVVSALVACAGLAVVIDRI